MEAGLDFAKGAISNVSALLAATGVKLAYGAAQAVIALIASMVGNDDSATDIGNFLDAIDRAAGRQSVSGNTYTDKFDPIAWGIDNCTSDGCTGRVMDLLTGNTSGFDGGGTGFFGSGWMRSEWTDMCARIGQSICGADGLSHLALIADHNHAFVEDAIYYLRCTEVYGAPEDFYGCPDPSLPNR